MEPAKIIHLSSDDVTLLISASAPLSKRGQASDDIKSQRLRNGEVVHGNIDFDGRVILYIIKADQTSYINYIKPLIFAEELQFPHVLAVITTKQNWYYKIHPERYVPALQDRDPETRKEIFDFEGMACLQYLAQRFDTEGTGSGRNAWEKGAVLSWTAYQTEGIG